jgi:hypothetical protein
LVAKRIGSKPQSKASSTVTIEPGIPGLDEAAASHRTKVLRA